MANELARVKQAANTLAHYSGKPDVFTNYGGGGRDPFLGYDGDGKISFDNEITTKRSFGITFNSAGAVADQEIILFPGIAPTAGKLVANDGAVGGGVTGYPPCTFATDPSLLRTLQEWVKFFPSRVVGAKLSSANQLQHEVNIDIYRLDPFRKATEPRTIRLSDHSNEHKNQLTMTTIAEGWQLDAKTEMRMKILQATSGTLTLYFGVRMDTADALRQKAAQAGAKVI